MHKYSLDFEIHTVIYSLDTHPFENREVLFARPCQARIYAEKLERTSKRANVF